MAKPELKPGDIFCVRKGSGIIGTCINACQWFWSTDGEAFYTHSGIIISRTGDTIEALYNGIRRDNLFKRYTGSKIIIGRIKTLTSEQFISKYQKITHYEGPHYPYFRLFLHL